MSYEVHRKRFQDELGKLKGETVPIKNSSHKAFIERLKKQVLSDDSSLSTGGTDSSDDDVCSEELMKELEAKFDELFSNLDDDD
ncbi:hypothetical protein [Anaeromassilibacillus sp. An172]|uniref:hypothetical protein n=1 Tax=Anaeromassilibacillus sp. An172 TaxID=1965570 RepID=UPI0011789E94|nr:hypothetical protein [Anaeromassilibacillus sp. An172]